MKSIKLKYGMMDKIPFDIIGQILSYFDIRDQLLICVSVCKQWNQAIIELPWAAAYCYDLPNAPDDYKYIKYIEQFNITYYQEEIRAGRFKRMLESVKPIHLFYTINDPVGIPVLPDITIKLLNLDGRGNHVGLAAGEIIAKYAEHLDMLLHYNLRGQINREIILPKLRVLFCLFIGQQETLISPNLQQLGLSLYYMDSRNKESIREIIDYTNNLPVKEIIVFRNDSPLHLDITNAIKDIIPATIREKYTFGLY